MSSGRQRRLPGSLSRFHATKSDFARWSRCLTSPVREDRIVEIRSESVPGGVPRNILEQIGVQLPPL